MLRLAGRTCVVVLLLAGCTQSPPPDERWQATPDKSQPAVAVLSPSPPQQIRPQQVVLEPDRRVDPNEFMLHDDAREPRVYFDPKIELETLRRVAAALTSDDVVELKATVVDGHLHLVGRARTYEGTAELKRGLGELVLAPKGLARVVDRRPGASTVRLELLTGEQSIQDYNVTDVRPLETAVVKAEVVKVAGKAYVAFEMRVDLP